jgi:hypothetical protein
MLKNLSKLSLNKIHSKLQSRLFNPGSAFTPECLESAPIPNKTIEFIKAWHIPEESHVMRLGGFTIFTKSSPKYGTVQWFPKLAEWDWVDELRLSIPKKISQEIVFGSGEGAELGVNGTIVGPGKGGPICINQDGSLVFYHVDDNYLEYAVNTDVEKLLYCLVLFQMMTNLSRKKTKKDTHLLCTVRPDYCDTIYEEMRAIDPKAIESPHSFWPLMLDLACFKHPLATGRRRYNIGK